jgi:hypothetical protein
MQRRRPKAACYSMTYQRYSNGYRRVSSPANSTVTRLTSHDVTWWPEIQSSGQNHMSAKVKLLPVWAASLDFRYSLTKGDAGLSAVELAILENLGLAVWISLILYIVAKIILLPVWAAILDFRHLLTKGDAELNAVELVILENKGLAFGIALISYALAKIILLPVWAAILDSGTWRSQARLNLASLGWQSPKTRCSFGISTIRHSQAEISKFSNFPPAILFFPGTFQRWKSGIWQRPVTNTWTRRICCWNFDQTLAFSPSLVTTCWPP